MALVEYGVAANGVCAITLNRPERLNAINDGLDEQLRDSFRRFDQDEAALVAILAGSGRAFCSGADVKERQTRPIEEMERLGGPSGSDTRHVAHLTRSVNYKPVIAAVHGYALGAGLRLMLSCDIVVAAANTQFQITEIPRGLHATAHWALIRDRCGDAFATELALTGRYWSAAEAAAHAMIAEVVPDGSQVERARAIAETIAASPRQSTRSLVRSRRIRLEETISWAHRMTETVQLFRTDDFHRSAQAFVNRRSADPAARSD